MNNKLSEIEWTCLWMAIRYAMNRQTIASAMLPAEIVTHYYNRLSSSQKAQIFRDLKENSETKDPFGNPLIDKPRWVKFMNSLGVVNHYTITLIDDSQHVVFEANDRIYPLQEYLNTPHKEIFILANTIK